MSCVVVHVCDYSIWEAEAGNFCKGEVILGYNSKTLTQSKYLVLAVCSSSQTSLWF